MKKIFTFLLMALLALAGFKSWGQETLTVCDGTTTNYYIPVNTFYFDTPSTFSQFIIPSSEDGMGALSGKSITQLQFHISSQGNFVYQIANTEVKCCLKEVGSETMTGSISSGLTEVFSGKPNYTESDMTIPFDTPYNYEGGNLLVSITVTVGSGSPSIGFKGKSVNYNAAYCYDYQNNFHQFIPKTTITYEAAVSCPAPTDLAASNVTATGATISWTGNDAESYDLAYGVASTFDLSNPSTYNNLTTTSVQLSGLTAETEYKCAVKAHCSDEDESVWSAVYSFTPSAKKTLTVNDETNTNAYVPIYGYWADMTVYPETQFIIPKEDLVEMTNGVIKSLTFYANYSSNFGVAKWKIYIGETDNTTLSGFASHDGCTLVYDGNLSINSTTLTIQFNDDYVYNGNNLLVCFNKTQKGTCSSSSSNSFYGTSAPSGSSAYGYDYSSFSPQSFLPKTTFTYTSGATCPKPKDLAVSDVTATGATISWTDNGAESYDLAYGVASTFDLSKSSTYTLQNNLTTTSVTLSGLTAETEYKCAVKAHCSDEEESAWSDAISFTPSAKLTICDASDFDNRFPLHGLYADATGTQSQFIIPSEMISVMKDCNITSMKFYIRSNATPTNFALPTWRGYIKEVNYTEMSGLDNEEGAVTFFQGTLTTCDNGLGLQFDFSEPFTYNGGNLLIGFDIYTNTPNKWSDCYFWGQTQTYHSAFNKANNSQAVSFIPKTTFTYEETAEKFSITLTQPEDAAVGTISADYEQAAAGTTVTLSATPAFGYEFGAWVENDDDVEIINNQFIMPEHAVEISASFNELTKYNVTVSSDPESAGTASVTYQSNTITEAPAGAVLNLSAIANPGFDFVSWTIGDEVVSTSANYNYTMPDNDVAIVANFGEHQFLHVNIDPNIVGGTITVNPSECDPGTIVTVTANAASGYQYMYGNITVTDANGQPVYVYQDTPSSTFEMPNTDVTVSATFSKSYYISSKAQHCTVSTSPMGSATAGANVDVFVTPEEGYHVTNVTATYEGGEITAVYSGDWEGQLMYYFTMPAADVTVNVVCALTYTVSYTQPTGGTISVSPTSYVPAGQEVSIDITYIYDHYSFDYDNYTSKISVKDASENPVTVNKEDNTHYNFSMPASNVTVSVTFDEAANYDIAVTQPEGCTIVVDPSENVYADEPVYLYYSDVESGYQFVEWVVKDGESTIELYNYYGTYYFIMPASENVTVTANVQALTAHTVNIADDITGGSIIAYTDNDHEAPINAYENNLVYLNNTPESGYQFVSYTVTSECGTVEVYNNFYFYMPDCDVTVSATFIKPETLTVYGNGGQYDYSGIYPIYTYWGDTQGTTSQFIIPAEELEDMVGGTIKEMKFFISSGGDTGGQIWECRIKEVDYTVLTGIVDVSTLTLVYSGHYLSFANNEWNVTFDTPFAYSGKNLLVSFECTTKGNYKSNSFWGENVEYNASYSSREGVSTFIPKTEFTYLPDPTVVFYDIEIAQVEAGTITASKTRAKADTEIELSMNMNEGYTFSRWIVKDADSQDVTVTNNIFTMPASNVTVTAEYNTLPRYNVTLVPSVGGSITATPSENILEGTWVKLVATPDHGYRFVSWSGSTEAGSTLFIVNIETSGFSMRASNATVTATFEALPTYEVNYYANGTLVNTLTPYEGDDIDITPCEVPEGVNFYGWATSEIDETPYLTAAPSIITEGTPVDAAKNLYAVFSYSEQIPATGKDGETWKKVESTSELSAGDEIVLVYSNLVMCTRENAYWEDYPVADVTISNGEITNLPENAAQFTLIANNGYWNLQYNELGATRILATNSYNNELAPKDLYESWYPTYMSIDFTATTNSNSVLFYNSDTYMYIRYRSDWSQITTSNGSSTTYACQAYKLDNPVITNTYYMTSVLADGEVAANTTAKNIVITTGTVTVDNNIVLTMNENGLFRNENAAKFVFKDGAEFIYEGEEIVNATFEKDIIGYNSVEASDGWYFIANPTDNPTVNLSDGSSYDLYTFNPAAAAEWHNEQYNDGDLIPEENIAISRETGYLYANAAKFTLKFEGELIPSGEDQTIDLVYYEGGESGREFPGFNLIGNPFPCTAYISGEFSIFKLNDDGSDVWPSEDNSVVPCEAFFVEATADNQEVTISTTAPEGKSRIMPIVVNSDRGETLDRAILHLEGTRNSHKFMMNPDRTNISFAKNGERFASVSRGDETEIPMNFTADHKGSYTISFNTENFEEEYLHLIDVVSGDNIDLLVTPSYTFEADADEYASRFRIVFGTTDINDDPATSSEPFVYISNGNLVINNVEGTASMQIVDMLGRIVRTETVCGSYNKPHNLKAGAYVITLDGRAQRIVIE